MRACYARRMLGVVAVWCAVAAGAQPLAVTRFPADRAVGVNPDTHLVLTFASAPAIGKAGQVRVYDAADHKLVDTLDMSIPAGPDPSRRVTATPAPGVALPAGVATSETTTTPAVRVTPADLHDYQLNSYGGLDNFHFYPVIVHGNVATITLHSHALEYGHKYIVQVDAGVVTPASGTFAGFAGDRAWTFTTKKAGPAADAARVVVAADGSGDFNTVQGALDFVPANPAKRVTVFVKNGTYEEIVFVRDRSNLTVRGEDRDKVQIGYANNSGFNPPQPGPNRRCAFSVYNSTGIELANLSLNNYAYGQAEGLLISGSKNVVSQVNIKGSGDALNLRGSVYLVDSRIVGDGDTILGVGPAFFKHCELSSMGPFMWIRNTDANHGNVFVDCTFVARERSVVPPGQGERAVTNPQLVNVNPNTATQSGSSTITAVPRPMQAVLARLPNNHGLNYPYAEAVLINCKLKGIPAAGWGPIDDDTTHLHLWEFNSTDLDGKPVDVSQRHAVSKQLTMPKDAKTIGDYSNPAFVLGGWTPVVEP